MSNNGYIKTNIEVIKQINPDDLSELVPDIYGKESGGSRVFKPLGSVSVGGSKLHLGVKVGESDFERAMIPLIFTHELADTAVIADRAPEIAHKLPRFMGLIEFDGNHAPAMLVEDMNPGRAKVRQVSASDRTRASLEAMLPVGSELDQTVLNAGMAFNIAGQERILDLHPSPFLRPRGDRELFKRYNALADHYTQDLVIRVAHDSPLAEQLRTDVAQPV